MILRDPCPSYVLGKLIMYDIIKLFIICQIKKSKNKHVAAKLLIK